MNPTQKENLPQEQTLKNNTLKTILREVIIFAVVAFGIVLPFRAYVAEPYLVDGRSMDPTFATGDYLIVDKLSYKIHNLERNSVIVFKYPKDTKKSFIKRVIGLPGETILIKDNVISIINEENPEGFVINSSYVLHPADGIYKKTLGENEYYVLGDNRAESFDSRSWGPLEAKYILGKPILRLFPINKIDLLPGQETE